MFDHLCTTLRKMLGQCLKAKNDVFQMPLFLNFFSNGWHYEMNAAEKASLNKSRKLRCIAGKHGFDRDSYALCFFGDAFAKFRKETISFVMSVC